MPAKRRQSPAENVKIEAKWLRGRKRSQAKGNLSHDLAFVKQSMIDIDIKTVRDGLYRIINRPHRRSSIGEVEALHVSPATNQRASRPNEIPFFQRLWRSLRHATRKNGSTSALPAASPRQPPSEYPEGAKDFDAQLSLVALDRLYKSRKPSKRLRAAACHVLLCPRCSADISLFLTAPNLYRRIHSGIESPLRNQGTRHANQPSSKKKTSARNSNKHSEPYFQRRNSAATDKPKRRST